MSSRTIREARERSGRAFDRAAGAVREEMDELREAMPANDVLIAGLVGATIGAGVGFLLSSGGRSETLPARARSLQRKGRRAIAARVPTAAMADAGEAMRDYAERAREAFEDLLEREARSLKRAIRRRRRSLGL